MTLQERLRESAEDFQIVPGFEIETSELINKAADRIDELEKALRDIIVQWDTPNWKLTESTGEIINRARAALEDK